MITLLIIADDFTGALDTGVQFAAHGAKTKVVTDRHYDFSAAGADVQVLVMDAETRHMDGDQAYTAVFQIVRTACLAGVPHIYKKTDSALRGNIGSELLAVMGAAETDTLTFVPAFPRMNRITVNGVHYIDGQPVAESVFGKDPFEPVLASDVQQIVASQADVDVVLHKSDAAVEPPGSPGIQLYDAHDDRRLWEIAHGLGRERLRLASGCAGFAAALLDLLDLRGSPQSIPRLAPALLVACGSVNPITQAQLACAEEAGFVRTRLTLHQKLDPAWLDSDQFLKTVGQWRRMAEESACFILDTNDPEGSGATENYALANDLTMEQVRVRISAALGRIVGGLLEEGLSSTLVLTGGDTLRGFMDAIGVSELTPVCETSPGSVLSHLHYKGTRYHLISKSGGFGEPEVLLRLAELAGATHTVKENQR